MGKTTFRSAVCQAGLLAQMGPARVPQDLFVGADGDVLQQVGEAAAWVPIQTAAAACGV